MGDEATGMTNKELNDLAEDLTRRLSQSKELLVRLAQRAQSNPVAYNVQRAVDCLDVAYMCWAAQAMQHARQRSDENLEQVAEAAVAAGAAKVVGKIDGVEG